MRYEGHEQYMKRRSEEEDQLALFPHVDMVNSPPHYNQAGIECLDAIRAATFEGYEFYLQGNILKYLWRYRYKNGIEDLKKARFYLDKMIAEYEERE